MTEEVTQQPAPEVEQPVTPTDVEKVQEPAPAPAKAKSTRKSPSAAAPVQEKAPAVEPIDDYLKKDPAKLKGKFMTANGSIIEYL